MIDLQLAAGANKSVAFSIIGVDLTGYFVELVAYYGNGNEKSRVISSDDRLVVDVDTSGEVDNTTVYWEYSAEDISELFGNDKEVGLVTCDIFATMSGVRYKIAVGNVNVDYAGQLSQQGGTVAVVEGIQGPRGWSPVFSAVLIGSSIAMRVEDWTGGAGDKPPTGKYLGPGGLVDDVADATLFASLAAAGEAISAASAQAEMAQSYAEQAQVARSDALVAAANTTANLDGGPVFFTEAELLAYAPVDRKPATLSVDNGSRKHGVYRRTSGVWPPTRESDTLPGVDARLGTVEATQYSDPEAPTQWVIRTQNGVVAFSIDTDARVNLDLNDAALARLSSVLPQRQDITVNSVTMGATPDSELPYRTVARNPAGDILIGYTADGKVWLVPDFDAPAARTRMDDVTVFDRPPTRLDNTARGYVAGAEWTHDQRVYVCAGGAKDAIWRLAPWDYRPAGNGWLDGDLPLPGDAVARRRPVVAAGFARLIPEYTGALAQIGRASDSATLNLGLDADGFADLAALRYFLRNDGGLGSVLGLINQPDGVVIPWVGTRPPRIYVYPQVGDALGAIIETFQADPSSVSEGFSIPYAFSSQSVSLVWCGSLHTARQDHPILELSNGTNGLAYGFSGRNTGFRNSLACYYGPATGGTWYSSDHIPSLNASAHGYSSSDTALTLYGPDGKTAAYGALPADSFTTGLIGKTTVGFFAGSTPREGGQIMGGVLIYDTPLSADEMAQVRRSFLRTYRIQPQARSTLTGCGDSIEQTGFVDSLFESPTKRTARLLNLPVKPYVIAQSGGGVDSERAYYDLVKARIYNPSALANILHIGVGTNNFGSPGPDNNTFSYVYPKIAAWVADAKALGFIVALSNIRPRNQWTTYPERGVERALYNQWCRDNWQSIGVDIFIDYAFVPIIGVETAWSDLTLYYDGTHLTSLGDAIEAQYRAARFNDYLYTRFGV